ncbi:hypothetical protein GCM10022393_09680 [Aquimarina addita]|uniref:LPXTG cell wall anchor domain-containing protein n=1 Tax=Aquimarina addita TaxID=870485 RepID=A0ABP7XCM8_9FLAO
MCLSVGYAHDADKAYFNIITEKKTTIIQAEFSWSIRNALINYDYSFKNAKTEEDINLIFFNYIQDKLKLFNAEGKVLPLLKVILTKNPDHSHSTNYTLIFEGTDVVKISNLILLEHLQSQQNYHTYSNPKGKETKFITNIQSPVFNLEIKKNSTPLIYYLIGGTIIIFVLLVLVYQLKKRKR